MNFIKLIVVLTALALSSSAFSDICHDNNSEVELTGVLTTRAIQMDPNDFGWVPADGFIEYPVLILDSPICYSDEEADFSNQYIVQVSMDSKLPGAAVLRDGIKVTFKGSLYFQHNAHHFQNLILLVE